MTRIGQQILVGAHQGFDALRGLVETGGHRSDFVLAGYFDTVAQCPGTKFFNAFFECVQSPCQRTRHRPSCPGNGHKKQGQEQHQTHTARPPCGQRRLCSHPRRTSLRRLVRATRHGPSALFRIDSGQTAHDPQRAAIVQTHRQTALLAVLFAAQINIRGPNSLACCVVQGQWDAQSIRPLAHSRSLFGVGSVSRWQRTLN